MQNLNRLCQISANSEEREISRKMDFSSIFLMAKNCLARDINFQKFFLATIELGGSFFFDGPSACHIMEVGQHAAELRSNTTMPFGLAFSHVFWSSGWVFSPSVAPLPQGWTVGCQACTQFKQTRDCKMYRFPNLS